MSTTIIREFSFEAAHRLPNVPQGHKCHRLHGHSWRCEVHVRGEVNPKSGWVCDFEDLWLAFEPFWQQLDHHTLNDLDGLDNPTSENLAHWIWDRLTPKLAGLCTIIIHSG